MGVTLSTWMAVAMVAPAALLFSIWLFLAGPGRRVNRNLAFLFLLEGLTFGIAPIIDFIDQAGLDEQATDFYFQWLARIASLTLGYMAVAYLGFVGAAIKHPITRPFQGRWTTPIIAVAWAPVAVWMWIRPEEGLELLLVAAALLVQLYGLVAAIVWWRSEKDALDRRHASTYLAAFGLRDAAWIFGLLTPLLLSFAGLRLPVEYGVRLVLAVEVLVIAMLAFAIFRTQFLGVDWRVKKWIARAFVGLVIFAAGITAAETFESYVENWTGSAVIGVAASGAAALGFKPLLVVGHWVAARLMPGTVDLEKVDQSDAPEVYAQQVRIAVQDGAIGDRERRMLEHFREQMGISKRAATGIEKRVAKA